MKFSALFSIAVAGGIASATYAFAPAPTFGTTTMRQQYFALDASRKSFISGNWKLNPSTKEEAVKLAGDIAASITSDSPDSDVALFVPYVFIEAAKGAADGTPLQIGAEVSRALQNEGFTFLSREHMGEI